jgi:hypothetical protein
MPSLRPPALLVVMLVLSLLACSADRAASGLAAIGGVTVRWAESGSDPGGFGVQQSGVQPGKLVSFGAMTLCVSGGSAAEITRAQFKQAEHLEIERFAVRTTPEPSLGNSLNGIVAEGFDLAKRTVTSQCDTDDDVSEFAADFVSSAPGIAQGQDLVLDYAAGAATKSVTIPVTIVLCSYSVSECPA